MQRRTRAHALLPCYREDDVDLWLRSLMNSSERQCRNKMMVKQRSVKVTNLFGRSADLVL